MTFTLVHMLVLHFSKFLLVSENMFGNCFCLLKENSFEKGEKQVVKQDLAKAKK